MSIVLEMQAKSHRRATMRELWSHPLGRVFAREDRMLTVLDPTVTFGVSGQIHELTLRRLTRLHGDAILSVSDVKASTGGRVVAETELVDAEPLAGLLRAGGLEPRRVLRILRRVARALARAHRFDLTHGALSTSSVLLGGRGERGDIVWVADFGLGEMSWADHRRDAAFLPCSPERTLGLPRAPSEDVYLFGCVAFAALTGSSVFEGDPETVRRRHAIEDAPSLHETSGGRDVPPALANLVAKCLAKDPDDRFADGAELDAALWQAQNESRIIAVPGGHAPVVKPIRGTPSGVTAAIPTPPPSVEMQLAALEPRTARRRGRSGAVVGSAALLMLAVAGGWLAMREREGSSGGVSPAGGESRATARVQTPAAAVALAAEVEEEPTEPRSDGRAEEADAPVLVGASAEENKSAQSDPSQKQARSRRDGPFRARGAKGATRRSRAGAPDIDDLLRAASAARARGDRKEAERLYGEVVARDRDYFGALEALGRLRFNHGDYGGAARVLVRAVKLSPKNAELRIRLGDAHFKMMQYDEARRQFEKARALGHPAANRRLERTHAASGG